MYFDLIIIHLVITYAHELHCQHHTLMIMNKFYFNEHKRDTWKCDWLIGHIISINPFLLPLHTFFNLPFLSPLFFFHILPPPPNIPQTHTNSNSLHLFFTQSCPPPPRANNFISFLVPSPNPILRLTHVFLALCARNSDDKIRSMLKTKQRMKICSMQITHSPFQIEFKI